MESFVGSLPWRNLVVTSGNVSAAVAQLLAAARVKALPGSDNQAGLEASARAVGECNRALVSATNIEEALASSLDNLTLDTIGSSFHQGFGSGTTSPYQET